MAHTYSASRQSTSHILPGRQTTHTRWAEVRELPQRNDNGRPQCRVDGCDSDAFFDGLCHLHGLQKYYRRVGSDHRRGSSDIDSRESRESLLASKENDE